jgi:hypothetical protein
MKVRILHSTNGRTYTNVCTGTLTWNIVAVGQCDARYFLHAAHRLSSLTNQIDQSNSRVNYQYNNGNNFVNDPSILSNRNTECYTCDSVEGRSIVMWDAVHILASNVTFSQVSPLSGDLIRATKMSSPTSDARVASYELSSD